jgi:WD40 repeat protein/serine/threonine protein kinase
MLKCPVCHADLAKLAALPLECPACGASISQSGDDRSSVQQISDSGTSRPGAEATIQSADSSLLPDTPKTSEPSDDDPNLSKTFVSDEWDDPPSSKTMDSGERPESASLQLLSDSPPQPRVESDKTVESSDSSLLPAGGETGTSGSDSADDPSNSKTFVSDEFDDPNSLTVQSGEFDESQDQGSGADPVKTVMFDEVDDADDPSMSKTVQSEEFALESAAGGGAEGADRTIISDEWDGPDGAQNTMLSDDLPQEAIRTMQTNWSGAFDHKTTPGMTVKGRSHGKDKGQSSLVIRERTLSSPGEQKPKGFAAEYELIKVLGEGGMGVVYDAKQMSVDRSVAVKMLKPKTAGDEKQRTKFLAEAVVTGELDHPNIVPIYDVGTSDRGLLFYSMKKVKGTPWIKVVTKKSVPENADILMKVADAVAFAHSRGVIHRDLKPENVMLGDFGEVLVMDWGLALPAPGYSKTDTISTSHSMGGTPAYMAPEMASGPLEKISFASDIYLLGAILYEILTGRAPHTGKNTMQCLFAAAKNDIRPPENNVSGELMDIAMKAMATEVKNRYATVADFQQALRDYRLHIESIVLSTRAAEELEAAEKTGDYQTYNRCLFAFDEAVKQWDGNTRAKSGLTDAQVKYANCALKKGDFDLGIELLDPNKFEHKAVLGKLHKARTERDAKQRTLKRLKVAGVAGTLAFIVMVCGFAVWINSEKEKAVAAEIEANKQKENALIAEKEANKQKENALEAKEFANVQKDKALEAEKDAKTQRDKAVVAEKTAVDQKTKAEYEGYVAQIGLAAAKIEENAFDSARAILRDCKPSLRNWEWRRLWYLTGLSELQVETDAPIDAVAFSPDGKRFITGGWKHTAKIWDTATGKPLVTLPVGGLYIHAVAFSPDGKWVATGGNDKRGYVRIWDSQSGAPLKTAGDFAGHTDAVLSVAFSRDGTKLLTGSYDKTARLWDVQTGQEKSVFRGHSWWVWSAAFSPDESQIVTASQDGSAILWNASTATRYRQFLEHSGPVYAAAFSPDGKRVATAGYDKKVMVWQPKDVPAFNLSKLAEKSTKAGDQTGDKPAEDRVPVLELLGHGAPVRAVSFSTDGKLVLSGSHDNSVKLWDSHTGIVFKTLHGHGSWVRACRFSHDNRTVVSVGHDHKALLWNIADYQELRVLGRVLEGHADAVLAASFTRDGKTIVTASRDRTARTWSFDTGAPIRAFQEGHAFLASNAAFYPDGKRLLTAAVDNTVRLWDVTSGTQAARFDRTGRSAALALAPGAKRILTGSDDKTAKVWDAETYEVIQVLSGHKYEVTAVAISPDGKWYFTADANGRGIIWDAETFEPVHRLTSHTGKITAAAFVPDSRRLLTASNDKTVGQWEVATGKEFLPMVLKHPDAVLSLALLPGGKLALTSCADKSVRIWDIEKAQVVGTLPPPATGMINAVAVSPDGRNAVTVNSEERTARLWDLETRREIQAPQGKDQLGAFIDFSNGKTRSQLWTAAFSPDGDSLLTVGGSEARLWDLRRGNELISFSPNGIVAAAGFSPDGTRIVTGSWDNSARIWNAENGVALHKLEGHKGHVNSAVYSPDGKLILTASDDKTAALWEAESGKLVRELVGHTDRVRSAVFSTDGQQILTASSDKTARLWDAATGKELRQFKGHQWAVLSAVLSTDGTRVLTGSEDNSAKLWDAATGKELHSLEGHTASVASVAFLPDGLRVLTGSQDNTAKLWDPETGKEILTLKGHSQEVTSVNTSANGRFVLTGSRDGTAIVWLASEGTQDIPETAAARTVAPPSP